MAWDHSLIFVSAFRAYGRVVKKLKLKLLRLWRADLWRMAPDPALASIQLERSTFNVKNNI